MRVNYINIIRFLVPIIFFSLILKYIYNLEKKKCECAINDDRVLLADLIKYYLFALLISFILSLMNNVYYLFIYNLLGLLILLLYVYISVVFFRYNKTLKEVSCECSQDDIKTAFKYYLYYYYFSLTIFIIFFMFISAQAQIKSNAIVVVKKQL